MSLQRQRESDVALRELEREIRSINALTRIVPAVKCRVDLQLVLHRGTLDPRVIPLWVFKGFFGFF